MIRLRRLARSLLDDAVMVVAAVIAEATRPRVGAWVEQCGSWSLYDERGAVVAGVSRAFDPRGHETWRFWAMRPFSANVIVERASREEAMAAALAALAPWCDVSAAKVPVSVAESGDGATIAEPVSPSGEGG